MLTLHLRYSRKRVLLVPSAHFLRLELPDRGAAERSEPFAPMVTRQDTRWLICGQRNVHGPPFQTGGGRMVELGSERLSVELE